MTLILSDTTYSGLNIPKLTNRIYFWLKWCILNVRMRMGWKMVRWLPMKRTLSMKTTRVRSYRSNLSMIFKKRRFRRSSCWEKKIWDRYWCRCTNLKRALRNSNGSSLMETTRLFKVFRMPCSDCSLIQSYLFSRYLLKSRKILSQVGSMIPRTNCWGAFKS